METTVIQIGIFITCWYFTMYCLIVY